MWYLRITASLILVLQKAYYYTIENRQFVVITIEGDVHTSDEQLSSNFVTISWSAVTLTTLYGEHPL